MQWSANLTRNQSMMKEKSEKNVKCTRQVQTLEEEITEQEAKKRMREIAIGNKEGKKISFYSNLDLRPNSSKNQMERNLDERSKDMYMLKFILSLTKEEIVVVVKKEIFFRVFSFLSLSLFSFPPIVSLFRSMWTVLKVSFFTTFYVIILDWFCGNLLRYVYTQQQQWTQVGSWHEIGMKRKVEAERNNIQKRKKPTLAMSYC